jgi:hypothetical protein
VQHRPRGASPSLEQVRIQHVQSAEEKKLRGLDTGDPGGYPHHCSVRHRAFAAPFGASQLAGLVDQRHEQRHEQRYGPSAGERARRGAHAAHRDRTG